MELKDFLQIAEYANQNWAKGSFTPEEVRENAEIYYADFLWSKANDTISETIKSLCKNLADDLKAMPDLEEPKQWLYQIKAELGMFKYTVETLYPYSFFHFDTLKEAKAKRSELKKKGIKAQIVCVDVKGNDYILT